MDPSEPLQPRIEFSTFATCDLRVGRILSASLLEGARRPAYVLDIDFGPLGRLKSTAQLVEDHNPEDLVDRKVVAVVNLTPKQVGHHQSRCLVLGAVHAQHVGLLSVPDATPLGTRIH